MDLDEKTRAYARERAAQVPEAEYPAFKLVLEREIVAAAKKFHAIGVADATRAERQNEEK